MASTSLVPYEASPPSRPARIVSDREQVLIADILREFGQYQIWRNPYGMQCEEISELILPTSRNTFMYGNFNFPGNKKTQQQVDATGALALHRFCAIADSLVTPRNMQWHGLQGNEYVMKDRASRVWFEDTTKLLFRMRYAANANFAAQNYNNWQSLGAFGNATMYVDRFDGRWSHGDMKGFRYKAVPFGETFFGENHQGKVDRIIRWFRMTAYQAEQKWGYDALPENLRSPLEQNSMWPYNFLHCVRPRDDYDPQRLDEKSLPFSSYYVSIEGRCLMQEEKGYRTFPYAVSRYDQTPGEVYGRGWASIVLPSLKTLNAEKVTFLTQGHRAASPVLLLADDGIVGMDLRPGAMNKGGVTADGKPLVHVLPSGDIQISEKMMGEERSIIDDVSLVSIFKVLTEHPNMTATQVIEIVNEKGMLVAPTLGRQHTEYVGGLVERELSLLSDMGFFDERMGGNPMPPRLREAMGEYEVIDTSPLALAANAGKVGGIVRSIETVRELVNVTQDMSLLDPFNFEKIVPFISRNQQVPEELMATPDEIAQKARGRAQAQAKQEQIQAAPAAAAMIKARAVEAQKAPPGAVPA